MGIEHATFQFVEYCLEKPRYRLHPPSSEFMKPRSRRVRFEVFTAVTMKNVVYWDIKIQFVTHRRHITSLLHTPAH
jgi:hypothetical protein